MNCTNALPVARFHANNNARATVRVDNKSKKLKNEKYDRKRKAKIYWQGNVGTYCLVYDLRNNCYAII